MAYEQWDPFAVLLLFLRNQGKPGMVASTFFLDIINSSHWTSE